MEVATEVVGSSVRVERPSAVVAPRVMALLGAVVLEAGTEVVEMSAKVAGTVAAVDKAMAMQGMVEVPKVVVSEAVVQPDRDDEAVAGAMEAADAAETVAAEMVAAEMETVGEGTEMVVGQKVVSLEAGEKEVEVVQPDRDDEAVAAVMEAAEEVETVAVA